MTRRGRRALWTALLLGAAAVTGAWAEQLDGRIHLGPGCSLWLQKSEGMWTSLLRSLSLVDGEVPEVDLDAKMIAPHQLFMGQDKKLYYRDVDDGSVHAVGTWTSPRTVDLDAGVELHLARSVQEVFEGRQSDALQVRLDSDPGPEVEPAERADFRFWLERLTEVYMPGLMSDADRMDSGVLVAALAGSLPQDGEPSAQQVENLRQLHAYVDDNPYEDLPGAMLLARENLRRVKAASLHGGGGLDQLLAYYEEIVEALEGR